MNTIRILAADTVQKAKSGHPGAPMGCAPMAHALWGQVMTYDPKAPKWTNRDRFVLSNGHGCALLYSMLHLSGYERPNMEDMKQFRQLGSVTAGHPENFLLDGVEVSTGPLGQGISNAVGLAIGESHMAATFNRENFKLFDHYTYVICGDGCLQEGVSGEASSLAGHLGLGKLIVLYDDNDITIDGGTNLSFTEDVVKRYEAYGWHVQVLGDGDSADPTAIVAAVEAAKAVTDKPSMIKIKTTIGLGSAKQGTHKVHGSPLGDEDLAATKARFGFDPEAKFVVPDAVREFYGARAKLGAQKRAQWEETVARYKEAFPDLHGELIRRFEKRLPASFIEKLPAYKAGESKDMASRKYSQATINAIAPLLPEMVGGSADLTPSNLTQFTGAVDYQKDTPHGRYLRFGVREHGMAAVCNGLAAYGGFVPYCATFLNFVGYALGAIRLSALSHFQVVYVMTHDSIGLGEDGPTHQPVETLVSLRGMPNMVVIRPADGAETSAAYALALQNKTGPTTISLTRQTVPNLEGSSFDDAMKGGYVVHRETAEAKVAFVATGSEVALCIAAAKQLKSTGISARVISLPSWEVFEKQSAEYKSSVFNCGCPVISVEAASTTGWERYSHHQVGMTTFGCSAPGAKCFEKYGFTVGALVEKAEKVVQFYSGKTVGTLLLDI